MTTRTDVLGGSTEALDDAPVTPTIARRRWLQLGLGLVCGGLILLHLDLVQPDGAIVLPRVLAYGVPATMLVAAAVFQHDSAAPPAMTFVFSRPCAVKSATCSSVPSHGMLG